MRSDSAFFEDWHSRPKGSRRSLERARHLLNLIGLPGADAPVLTVVGSKGKGTTATYASAFLAATGARVVTVTSPGLRSNRERIRLNGAAISDTDLAPLGTRIAHALRRLPDRTRLPGHLAPAGLFTAAGVLYANEIGVDYLVLEAGMGGGSDEVSLFSPRVVAITEIFAEHVGVLGDTPAEIAREKASVVSPRTRAVLSLPQQPAVREAIETTISQKANLDLDILNPDTASLSADLLPPSYGRWNAELGCAAATKLLSLLDKEPPAPSQLTRVLNSVRLPGRFSHHLVPGTDIEVCIDSPISRAGIATALKMAHERWNSIDHVLLCLPDNKDLEGSILELADYPVTFIRLTNTHFTFTKALPPKWTVLDQDEITPEFLADLGHHILSLGTALFSGHMLSILNVSTEQLFVP
ncbi:hypothetical protein [Acrocarpospora catenulata]|uniref:hypothetical protein n=1 Tax=Acrocarpospora catenulata TaxID=2836182 RepID=UPI001BDA19B9|nr:hypothetical protein [Acrocarpospora catenulata]